MDSVGGQQRSCCRLRRMPNGKGRATLADMDGSSAMDANPRGKWGVVYQLSHGAMLPDTTLGSGSPSLVYGNLLCCPRGASPVDVFGSLGDWAGSAAGTCYSYLDQR